jgi:hypothetical protein
MPKKKVCLYCENGLLFSLRIRIHGDGINCFRKLYALFFAVAMAPVLCVFSLPWKRKESALESASPGHENRRVTTNKRL